MTFAAERSVTVCNTTGLNLLYFDSFRVQDYVDILWIIIDQKTCNFD